MKSSLVQTQHFPVQTVVDLINEYADTTRLAAGETDDAYSTLNLPAALQIVTEDLIEVANDLHSIFARPQDAAQSLNDLADRIGLRHRLDSDGALTWTHPDGSNSVRAGATVSLITFIASYGTSALGTCGAHNCVDVYTDRSHAQARTYCSERCNNRARAARWRARRNTSSTTQGPTTDH